MEQTALAQPTDAGIPSPGNDFADLVEVLGEWFEGFAKMACLIDGYDSQFYVGDKLMIQRLVRHSRKINLHLRQLRDKYKPGRNVRQETEANGNSNELPGTTPSNDRPVSSEPAKSS